MKATLIPVTIPRKRFLDVLREVFYISLYHAPIDNHAKYNELNGYIRTTYQRNFKYIFPN